ncbi:SemiSWEET transporter [Mucilaginibacter sp. AW1-3]
MNYIQTIGYMAAFGTTISFLPQAVKTIRTKDTSGISLLMYTCFTIGTLLWLIYGLLSGQYPVATANAITFLFAVTILIYKIKYK